MANLVDIIADCALVPKWKLFTEYCLGFISPCC